MFTMTFIFLGILTIIFDILRQTFDSKLMVCLTHSLYHYITSSINNSPFWHLQLEYCVHTFWVICACL